MTNAAAERRQRRQLCPSHLTVVMSRGQQKPAYNADVAALFTDLKQHAENIVQSDFPRNVRLFDDLLNTDQFAMSTLERLMNDTRAVGLVLNKLLLLKSNWTNNYTLYQTYLNRVIQLLQVFKKF